MKKSTIQSTANHAIESTAHQRGSGTVFRGIETLNANVVHASSEESSGKLDTLARHWRGMPLRWGHPLSKNLADQARSYAEIAKKVGTQRE